MSIKTNFADDIPKPEESRRVSPKSEMTIKLTNIKSAAVSTTIFKCLQIHTAVNPHPVPDPCINAIEINRSATDLTSCVDEITFLREQSIALMKQHAVMVTSELLQSGLLEESFVLNLEDEEGNKLVKELEEEEMDEEEEEEDGEEEEEEEEEEESKDIEEVEYDEATKEAEEFIKYDKIKLALARKLIDLIYDESRSLQNSISIKGKLIWLDRIKTTLGLNKVENIYMWLDKLSEVTKTQEIFKPQHFNVWKTPNDDGLNASREHNLTIQDIWKEIQAIFLDNLEVGEPLVEQMLIQHVINEHTMIRLLSLPNRKAKVRALLNHLESMGSTVMYMFGEGLISTGQRHLGRIIIKRLDDNKIMYNISQCQNVKKQSG